MDGIGGAHGGTGAMGSSPVDTLVSRARGRFGLVALYSATLLIAALLLFSVQPMFTKRVLPLLGGTPGVWSVAMVVFQGLLLAGYAYAHVLTRYLPLRAAMVLHGIVLVVGFSALPITIAAGFEEPPQQAQALWLVGLFLASIGAPYFALSASAPLLQAWFARSGDPHADDPYFLYRASNLGSLTALIAYPFLIEPFIGLAGQSALWTIGYGGLIAAIAVCALSLRASATTPAPAASPALAVANPARRLAWIGLSAVPSGLLVAATAYISTDVAAVPLIWVLPLALYLSSFILAFRDHPKLPSLFIGAIQVAGTSFLCLEIALGTSWHYLVDLFLVLLLLFVGALSAHRTLYRLRPPAAELTAFYLYTSLGGVLGGIFAALVAPHIFSRIDEFPILLVAALACRPEIVERGLRLPRAEARNVLLCLFGVTALAALLWPLLPGRAWVAIVMAGLLFVFAVSWREPARAALVGIAVALATILLPALNSRSVESHRSFFGVHQIQMSEDGRHRLLWHGTTLHGAMRVTNDDGTPYRGRPEPTTYYAPGGPMAQALDISRAVHGPVPSVSVVGLGTGSLACNAQAGETWTYYEIDPDVIRIAGDPRRFRFLSECVPGAEIVPGDARLTLARRGNAARVLVVDAFSSDAVPMHLLTREALDVELAHLDARGLVVFHISNRNFQLKHVLARVGAERGLVALERLHAPASTANYEAPSQAVILTRDPAITREALARGWRVVAPDMARRPWSDDYANAIEAMVDRIRPPAAPAAPEPVPVARRD